MNRKQFLKRIGTALGIAVAVPVVGKELFTPGNDVRDIKLNDITEVPPGTEKEAFQKNNIGWIQTTDHGYMFYDRSEINRRQKLMDEITDKLEYQHWIKKENNG